MGRFNRVFPEEEIAAADPVADETDWLTALVTSVMAVVVADTPAPPHYPPQAARSKTKTESVKKVEKSLNRAMLFI